MKMKSFIISTIISVIFVTFITNKSLTQSQDNIVIGKSFKIYSKVLNEDRNIFINLPENYNTSKNRYAVIYLLDGETHFNYTAGVVQFLAGNNRMPEAIVIGIPNTNRNRDFTLVKVDNVPFSGGGDNFLKFMKEELIPYVDNNFRTHPYRILIGHSLCGMFCFYTLFTETDLFNAYIALSPWLIWNNNYMLDFVGSKIGKLSSLNKYLYFTAGSLEQQELLDDMVKMDEIFKAKAPKDFTWKYKLMEEDDHGSLVLPTIHDGLRELFSDWYLPNSVAFQGLNSFLNHYDNITKKFGFEVQPSEAAMNNLGYYFLQRQNMEEAIAFFKKNVELFPESANVYDSLGEAYEKSNQINLAVENYEIAYKYAKAINHPNLQIYKTNFERARKLSENKN
jgi:uncharacterized protein